MLDNHHLQLAALTLLAMGAALVRLERSEAIRDTIGTSRWEFVVRHREMSLAHRVILAFDAVSGVAFTIGAIISLLSFFDLLPWPS